MHVHRPVALVLHDVEVGLPPGPRHRRRKLRHRILQVIGVGLHHFARAIRRRSASRRDTSFSICRTRPAAIDACIGIERLQRLAGFVSRLFEIAGFVILERARHKQQGPVALAINRDHRQNRGLVVIAPVRVDQFLRCDCVGPHGIPARLRFFAFVDVALQERMLHLRTELRR